MELLNTTERTEFITGLRELADYLDRNPGLPIGKWVEVSVSASSSEMDEVDATSPTHVLRRMKEPGRTIKKEHYSDTLRLSVDFGGKGPWGPRIRYTTSFEREQVCKAKIVGTETRKLFNKFTDEDRAAELKAELEQLRATETVPVVEYDCAPVLKAAS